MEHATDAVAMCGPFELLPTGAAATRPATFEEWEDAFKWCRSVERASSSRWWIGDLLLHGEDAFGDLHHAALATDYDPETLSNLKYIAGKVEASRRRDDLSHSHHAAVAALSPDEQVAWLVKAKDDGLTVHALRRQIQESKVAGVHPADSSNPTADEGDAEDPSAELWIAVRCNDPQDQVDLVERLRAEGRTVYEGMAELCDVVN